MELQKQFKMDPASEETAKVTRPTTAILIHPEARGISAPKAYMKLDQTADTIPIRITMQAQKVTKDGVNNEVELALKEVGSYDRSKAPIPQRLIARESLRKIQIPKVRESYRKLKSLLLKWILYSCQVEKTFLLLYMVKKRRSKRIGRRLQTFYLRTWAHSSIFY